MRLPLIALALLASTPARAETPGEALNRCMVAQLGEADRVVVTRWLFAVLAAHPAVADMAEVTPAQGQDATRRLVDLVTRLLTGPCRPQAVTALRREGHAATDAALEALGQAAMEALTSDPAVTAQMERFSRVVDTPALRQLAADAGIKPEE